MNDAADGFEDDDKKLLETFKKVRGRTPSHLEGLKNEVCNQILMRLGDCGGDDVVNSADFAKELYAHFNRLPARYAWGVNTERVEYVLTHKKMLQGAISGNYPAFHVRSIHVPKASIENENVPFHPCTEVSPNEDESESPRRTRSRQSMHSAPSFGSSASFNALAFDAEKSDQESNCGDVSSPSRAHAPMHEVTFSTIDKPKLLSQLSALLVDVGLNIREAHVFSTVDGYSLDVFVVDGWHSEDTQDLQQALEDAVARFEKGLQILQPPTFGPAPLSSPWESDLRAPNLSPDDWEIDYNQLKCVQKVASGSFGDLYRGTYCGQDVAIKILKSERLSESLQREFAQEVLMMRKVRHKNAVQLIGTCTKLPHLCIVTEFMSGGSLYDYLHKRKGTLKLPMVLRVAIDISKGMDYLHQSNIIHRDLKSANILMDENEVVKVADFGVARFQAPNGVMTAETGTYRWMAPEVIEHKPYDRKADVFSFGIVLWELLTGKLPYDYLTPLQAAVSVVQKGLRPSIPKHAPPKLTELLERCWCANPAKRPEFSEITLTLQKMDRELEDDGDHDSKKTEKKTGGLFSTLKKSTGVH
ncbi:hypothetical protein O6H91_18G054700 [Diphasiastrum complanatum]|uniref:Uncharacterized protein n=1 Tax=Diphasiastrum complanatum TaxID=34168 RepID=A0ACC2B1D1_DIPCM|nr:hypothetical protein O6H91_18G054700 [Diphasiastrum complanatum]